MSEESVRKWLKEDYPNLYGVLPTYRFRNSTAKEDCPPVLNEDEIRVLQASCQVFIKWLDEQEEEEEGDDDDEDDDDEGVN